MNKKSTFRSVANNYLTHPYKEAGITLVALVVTIIVLLILAGISVNMVLENNGVLQRTKDSVSVYRQAEENELIAFNETDLYIANMNQETNQETNKVMLYDRGVSNVEWEKPVPNRTVSWDTALEALFETNYIKLFQQNNDNSLWRSCGFYTKNKIDLTEYSKLGILFEVVEENKAQKNNESGNHFLIQISNNSDFDYTGQYGFSVAQKGMFNEIIELDDKNGENYIKFFTYTAKGDGYSYTAWDQDVRIYSIWLEK